MHAHHLTTSRAPGAPSALLALLPRWEAAPAFAAVAAAMEETLRLPPIARTREGVDIIGAADLASFLGLGVLPVARPVYVGREQLLALPSWSEDDPSEEVSTALRYAAGVRLAFDTLFLDFTGPTGEPSWIGDAHDACSLYGAALFRGQTDVPGALIGAGELAIVPFGSVRYRDGEVIPAWALEQQLVIPRQAPLGMLIVGGRRATAELWLGESGYSGALSNNPAEVRHEATRNKWIRGKEGRLMLAA